MVEGHRQGQHRSHGERALHGDRPLDDPTDREDRRLRCVHDRLERIDAVHAEVGDRERATLDVLRAQRAGAGRPDDLLPPRRDLGQAQPVGAVHDRDDQRLAGCDGDADVDAGPGHEIAAPPRRREARVPGERSGTVLHEQIRDGDALGASGLERARVDVARQHELRHLLPGARHPLRHSLPDGPDLGGRRAAARRLHVGRDDGSVGTAAGDRVEVGTGHLRESPGLRRGEPTPCRRARSRSRSSRCLRAGDRCGIGRGLGGPRGRSGRSRERLAGREHEGDHRADGNLGAFGSGDGSERAVCGRLDLDGHLVRLDLEQRLAPRDVGAVRLEPAQDLARLLRHPERGHDHLSRHAFPRCAPNRPLRRRPAGC